MYHTSTALALALSTQKLYAKVVCGSTTIGAEQVKKCVYSATFGAADALTIGGVTAASVSLTLSGTYNLKDKTVVVSVGAEVESTVQYVPLGTFAVTDCKRGDGTTTITAYDAAYYALGGTYTPTVSSGATVAAVMTDVATQCSLTLATLPAAAATTTVTGDLTGKTCREMVGYLAALVGCNALIDRDGKLALRWFADSGQSYGPSDYYNAGLSIDGTNTLACIRAEVETSSTDTDGNTSVTTDTYTAGGTGAGVTIQNPYMTQAVLDAVWASIGGLTYTVGSCDIFHGLLTEPGDLVTITDKAGASHTLAVMTLELSIDGGCRAKIQAMADSATDTSANVSGSMTRQINKIADAVTEFYTIVAQKAKITDLEATNAEITSLKADVAEAGELIAKKANITDLNASNAEINALKSNKASVGDLNATNAEIDALKTSKANVADLNAANAEITDLKSEKADVDLLNVVKATIENLLVRGGIITDSLSGVEINATKYLTGVTIIGDVIKAGTLAANRIILTGSNGLIYELNANAGNLTASQLTEEQYKQAIDGSVLVASSITTDKLAAGSVTAQVIASGAVDTDKLAAKAVQANNIDSGAITTDKLAAKAVTTDKIETEAITTDKLAVNAVKAKNIDVENLFAQDITAKGTITGAKLIGAILSGGSINITGSYDGYTGQQTGYIKTQKNKYTDEPELVLGVGGSEILVRYINDGASPDIILDAPCISIGPYGEQSETTVYNLTIEGNILGNPAIKSYTSFSGGVISSGTINVVKYLGWCQVFGEFKLSAAVSDWTEVLSVEKVPMPAHGINIYVPSTNWGSSFVRAPRIQINGNGGLRVRYGAAATYNFSASYPI